MQSELDELQEAGEILLTLRQVPPPGIRQTSEDRPRPVTPPDDVQKNHPESSPSSECQPQPIAQQRLSPRSLDGSHTPPYGYGYPTFFYPYFDQSRVPKRMFQPDEHKYFAGFPMYFQPMRPMPMSMIPQMQQPKMMAVPPRRVSDLDSVGNFTHLCVHRFLCKQVATVLAEKLGYGSIEPFRPVDPEYNLVYEGVRTMFYSKNKKAAWRTMYRNFLDYIGVKTRKFPPSWWCVSNKDITPQQREKCMRLLLTIGIEMLALLDECGHTPFAFQPEVDASKLQAMGLSIRDDISYWQFWEKEWKDLAADVKFESAASMWYLAIFNRWLSFLGDGVLKFMTFLIVRRCDFFRVHTGKHAQGKVAKRYIMNSNSMSNSYARLMSIQLLEHTARPKSSPESNPSPSSATHSPLQYAQVSPPHSPPHSPTNEDEPDLKRSRVEE